jgi:hypothetical protein
MTATSEARKRDESHVAQAGGLIFAMASCTHCGRVLRAELKNGESSPTLLQFFPWVHAINLSTRCP